MLLSLYTHYFCAWTGSLEASEDDDDDDAGDDDCDDDTDADGNDDDHDDDHPHGKIDSILANNVKVSEVQEWSELDKFKSS